MKLIASFDGVIEQRKGFQGLGKDFRVEHKKNVPFDIPDSLGEAYLRTNVPSNVRYKEVVSGNESFKVEETVETKVTTPVDTPPAADDFTNDDPPTADQLRQTAISSPDKVLRFASSLGVEGTEALKVAEDLINQFGFE
ncbi:MAG: hypothetical protein ACP5N7_05635 [Candidatus Pacearchaeota archaeon]